MLIDANHTIRTDIQIIKTFAMDERANVNSLL